ncbi:MAG: response regulator [Candidatus Omnitrophica bacterium]|nr:response regulator [Candidatus Omnitrophota bacterium]
MMKKNIANIKIITYELSLLYLISSGIYLFFSHIEKYHLYAVTFVVIFMVLLTAALATTQLKEWGRSLLVFGNILFILYGLPVYVLLRDLVPLSYLIMGGIVVLYYSKKDVRQLFHEKPPVPDKWKSILIVDDDQTLIHSIRPILIANGFSVLTAVTGEEGLMVAKKQKPDLILLDVILPGIKGREVCQKLKADAQTQAIPVVFLTAKDSPDDIQAERNVGGAGHLTKPVDPKVLIDTIQNLL